MPSTQHEVPLEYLRNRPEPAAAGGPAEAEIRVTAEAVLYVLDIRGISTSEDDRSRITGRTCPTTLVTWLQRAVTAGPADTADRLIA